MAACYKRALSMKSPGGIEASHPLAAAWSNAKMGIEAEGPDGQLVAMHRAKGTLPVLDARVAHLAGGCK